MNFGKTIASFRKKWGIDQQDLAKGIGVSKAYVSIVENGSRKPSVRLLTKIAEYFEVPLSLLVYEASKSSDSPKNGEKLAMLETIDPIIQELANFLLSTNKKVSSKQVSALAKSAGNKKHARNKNS